MEDDEAPSVSARDAVVDRLAKSAVAAVSAGLRARKPKHAEKAAVYLTKAVLDQAGYDRAAVLDNLTQQGIDAETMLDYCIPRAAEALGTGWVEDELTFTSVSAATSRLYGLSKAVGEEWDGLAGAGDGLNILLVSFRREDHLLGPGILAQQLRRRSHSVHAMSNTDSAAIRERLDALSFDCILVSVASLVSLDTATEELAQLRKWNCIDIPVVIGGGAFGFRSGTPEEFHVDLIESDIDVAVSKIEALRSENAGRNP